VEVTFIELSRDRSHKEVKSRGQALGFPKISETKD
jgi:hypothetical protein